MRRGLGLDHLPRDSEQLGRSCPVAAVGAPGPPVAHRRELPGVGRQVALAPFPLPRRWTVAVIELCSQALTARKQQLNCRTYGTVALVTRPRPRVAVGVLHRPSARRLLRTSTCRRVSSLRWCEL